MCIRDSLNEKPNRASTKHRGVAAADVARSRIIPNTASSSTNSTFAVSRHSLTNSPYNSFVPAPFRYHTDTRASLRRVATSRASAKPSPPLFPGPHSTTKSVPPNASNVAVAAARPAARISASNDRASHARPAVKSSSNRLAASLVKNAPSRARRARAGVPDAPRVRIRARAAARARAIAVAVAAPARASRDAIDRVVDRSIARQPRSRFADAGFANLDFRPARWRAGRCDASARGATRVTTRATPR